MFKKPSKLLFIMIAVLVAALLSSCQNGTEEPAIKISFDSEELNVIYYGDSYNKKQEDIEKNLKGFMVGKKFSDLPSITYGDIVQIEALNFETDEFEIYYYVMDDHGNIISDYDINPLNISFVEERNTEFTFEGSHDLERYLDFIVDGKLINGLLIRCKIDKASFAFATLVLSVSE